MEAAGFLATEGVGKGAEVYPGRGRVVGRELTGKAKHDHGWPTAEKALQEVMSSSGGRKWTCNGMGRPSCP